MFAAPHVVMMAMDSQFNLGEQGKETVELPVRLRIGMVPRARAEGTRTHQQTFDGVCIVGCEPACGKTVLMSGLAGVLSDHGARIRAIKPVTYARQDKSTPEFSFISGITHTAIDYSRFHLYFPPLLSDTQWEEIIIDATSGNAVTFVELPGAIAMPLTFEREDSGKLTHEWRNTADLISEFALPVILVARHAPDAFEKLSLSLCYLKTRGIPVLAVATVEVNPLEAHFTDRHIPMDDFHLLIITNLKVPYLGCLKYSPSISVPKVSQGNLKRTTEECMDLLVLRRSLNLPV